MIIKRVVNWGLTIIFYDLYVTIMKNMVILKKKIVTNIIYYKFIGGNMKRKLGIVLSISFITIMGLVIYNYVTVTLKDKKTITTVVNQILTTDNEMIALFDEMYTSEPYLKDMLAPGLHAKDTSAIDRKLEEMYRPYIASNWFEAFMNRFYITYYDYSTNTDYNQAINHIDIKQSKTDADQYIFTAYLDNINNENEQDIIQGVAQIQSSDRKINNLQFFKVGS